MGVWEEAMRRRWAWGLAAVLVIGVTASRGLARDDDDEDTSQMKPPPRDSAAIRYASPSAPQKNGVTVTATSTKE